MTGKKLNGNGEMSYSGTSDKTDEKSKLKLVASLLRSDTEGYRVTHICLIEVL